MLAMCLQLRRCDQLRASLGGWARAVSIVVALFTFACAGCGGGFANGPSGSIKSDTHSPSVPVAAAAAGSGNINAIEALNQIRNAVGVRPLVIHGALAKAALAHASYMAANQTKTVEEDASLAGFSGVTAEQRARAAGYGGMVVLEVQIGTGEAAEFVEVRGQVDAMMWPPLTRLRLLAPDMDEVGSAFVGGSIVTAIGMSGIHRPTTKPAQAYPFDGQSGVPTHYSAGAEAALFSGLPRVTGPALTLGASSFSTFRYTEVSLRAEGSGQVIPLAVPDAGPGRLASLIFFPLQPLSPGTAYVWQVTAEVDGQPGNWRARFVTAL